MNLKLDSTSNRYSMIFRHAKVLFRIDIYLIAEQIGIVNYFLIKIRKKTNPIPNTNKDAGIHSGEVIHHHDQSTLSVNLSTRNTKNSASAIPIPP